MIKRKISMFIAAMVTVASLSVGTAFAKSKVDNNSSDSSECVQDIQSDDDCYYFIYYYGGLDGHNKDNDKATDTPCKHKYEHSDLATSTPDKYYHFDKDKDHNCATDTPKFDEEKYNKWLEEYQNWLDQIFDTASKDENHHFATKTPGKDQNHNCSTATPDKDFESHKDHNCATSTPEFDEEKYNKCMEEYQKWLDEIFGTITPDKDFGTVTPGKDFKPDKDKNQTCEEQRPEFDEEEYNKCLEEYQNWLDQIFAAADSDFDSQDKEHHDATITPAFDKDGKVNHNKNQDADKTSKGDKDKIEDVDNSEKEVKDDKANTNKLVDVDKSIAADQVVKDSSKETQNTSLRGNASEDGSEQVLAESKTSDTADGQAISFALFGTLIAGISTLFVRKRAK